MSSARRIEIEVGEAARRLSGWGELTIEQLVDQIDRQPTNDAKGRVLEELVCRLLQTVPGFQVGGRVRTETEEIDIRVTNGSDDPVWRREGALLLVECKNWSSKCGKDELVLFEKKLGNRRSRCSCGLLVSWNGFAKTVTKEMLRGSNGDLVIDLVEGRDLRAAVRGGGASSPSWPDYGMPLRSCICARIDKGVPRSAPVGAMRSLPACSRASVGCAVGKARMPTNGFHLIDAYRYHTTPLVLRVGCGEMIRGRCCAVPRAVQGSRRNRRSLRWTKEGQDKGTELTPAKRARSFRKV